MYDSGRYFTVTGWHIEGTPRTVEGRSHELKTLHQQIFAPINVGRKTGHGADGNPHLLSDAELIERARRAANGAKFARLWAGDWTGYNSQSEADLALCIMLAFWTGRDPVRIDSLFRQSKLFRKKWDERHRADGRTYGEITVDKAIGQTLDVWSSDGKFEEVSPKAEGAFNGLPTIQVNDRQLREVTHDAMNALDAANNPPALFVRTGHLVRIRSDEFGRAAIQAVTKEHLRERLAEISNMVQLGQHGTVRDCFPPFPVIENILALRQWPFPPLQGIVEMPILRPDGTLLSKPGYDSTTHLFYSPASGIEVPDTEEEWRKHITTLLSSGATVITIDNVEHRLESASLAIALTAQEWTDIILGLSKVITCPVRVTWIATGNNIRLGGDLPRRCYSIRLDSKVSRPWKRTGFKHPDLLAWVSEHRGELLVALLTLANAWYAAHKPEAPVPANGSFEEWARTVGGVLHHAGITGFLANLEEMYESADESAVQLEAFLQALETIFGERPFTVKQVTEHIAGDGALSETVPHELADEVEKKGSFRRRPGHAFSKRVGTRYGDSGIHLERAGEEKRATKWRVSLG